MTTGIFEAAVVRTWSYCGGLDPVMTSRPGASTRALMLMKDYEVETVVVMTTVLRTLPLRSVVMAPARVASALPEAQAARMGLWQRYHRYFP